MASIYSLEGGGELAAGLQGCKVCDEAIQAAQRCADELCTDVHLADDDGDWIVHPACDGSREAADPYRSRATDNALLAAMREVAEVQPDGRGQYWIRAYAPDNNDFDGDMSPGSEWDEECERLLETVQDALPVGWSAEWVDDDVCIEWVGSN